MIQDTETTEQRPKPVGRWWRRIRRVILGLLTLLVVLLVAGWIYVAWANAEGERAVACVLDELRQRQLPASMAEVLAASPAAERPAGRYLYAAAALADDPNDDYSDVPEVGQVNSPEFGKPIPPEMARRLAEYVESHREYFALLDKAEAANERQELIDWLDGSINKSGQARRDVQARLAASLATQAGGDANEAIRCCARALWIGSTFDGQSSLIVSLSRAGANASIVASMEKCLGRTHTSAAILRAAQGRLLHEQAAIDIAEIAKADAAQSAELMTRCNAALAEQTKNFVAAQESIERWRRDVEKEFRDSGVEAFDSSALPGSEVSKDTLRGALALQWTWAYLCPGAYEYHFAQLARKSIENLAHAAQPDAELAKWANEEAARHKEFTEGTFAKAAAALLRCKAHLRVAAAALSVEVYRIEHGDWPAKIADVKDAGVLNDPFTGLPLGYTRTGNGVIVYSVGENLADDGGKGREAGGDDLVFRLLDPDRRNKP